MFADLTDLHPCEVLLLVDSIRLGTVVQRRASTASAPVTRTIEKQISPHGSC